MAAAGRLRPSSAPVGRSGRAGGLEDGAVRRRPDGVGQRLERPGDVVARAAARAWTSHPSGTR